MRAHLRWSIPATWPHHFQLALRAAVTKSFVLGLAAHNLQNSPFYLPLTSVEHPVFVYCLLLFVSMHVLAIWDTHNMRTANRILLSFLIYVLSVSTLLPTHCRYGQLLLHLVTHNDAPQSVGLLWTSDRPVAETSTWQHKALPRHRHAHGGIRTCNFDQRAAADPCLSPRGHVIFTVILYLYIGLLTTKGYQGRR